MLAHQPHEASASDRDRATLAELTGDLAIAEHAEALARSITYPSEQVRAMVAVAGALAQAGDHDRAEALARSIEASATSVRPGWPTARLRKDAMSVPEMGTLAIEPRTGTPHAQELAAHLDNWSDWVQRRLVPEVEDAHTLAVLARHGRTRKVRNAAAERLRHVPGESQRRPGPG